MVLLVTLVFVVAIMMGAVTALTDAQAANAASDRQIAQMMGIIGQPPTKIAIRPGDRARDPGDPAVEAWYQAYERQFPKADPYPPGAMQAPVPIPYTA